jgi:hypothetical protein
MNIVKQTGGNVVLTDAAGNILKSFVNVNALDIKSSNEIIVKYGYNQWHSIFASALQFTQVEPAAAVAWSGDAYALAALLSSDFFFVSSSTCSDAIVENSDASYTANVASGATLILPDTDVEVNGNLEGQVVSVQTVDIQLSDGVAPVVPTSINLVGNTVNIEVPAAVSRSTAKLMKTGQTTSYATGDDGDFEAGRDVDFFTLAENNPFGNTNRFTSTTGNQTYTNNIVIDWSTYDGSTVLGYDRVAKTPSPTSFNAAMSAALALTTGGFTGWRVTNIKEIINIARYSTANVINYSPLSITATQLWTSNSLLSAPTGDAVIFTQGNGLLTNNSKNFGSGIQYIAVRTFTVTGTTLS